MFSSCKIQLFFFFVLLTSSNVAWCHKKPSFSQPYSGLHARVLGAGVIGLTNAVMLQRVGFNVTIHASTSPFNYDPITDSDPYYASPQCGGWVYGEGTSFYWESTFDAFTGYSRMYPFGGVGLFETHDYFAKNITPQELDEYTPFKAYAKEYRILNQTELDAFKYPNGTRMFAAGVSWLSPISVTMTYLESLAQTFLEQGGVLVHEKVNKISDLTSLSHKTDLVVISPGLGASTLGDLMDTNIVPGKGQVVVVRQPQREDMRITIARYVDFWPKTTFILPRLSDEILLGGSNEFNVSTLNTTASVIRGIIERTALIEPKLKYATHIRDYAAFRPLRWDPQSQEITDPRIEIEPNPAKFSVPVIYAYGHGFEGWEGSWGTAWKVLDLIKKINFHRSGHRGKPYDDGLVA